jgi:hypothetical protein
LAHVRTLLTGFFGHYSVVQASGDKNLTSALKCPGPTWAQWGRMTRQPVSVRLA